MPWVAKWWVASGYRWLENTSSWCADPQYSELFLTVFLANIFGHHFFGPIFRLAKKYSHQLVQEPWIMSRVYGWTFFLVEHTFEEHFLSGWKFFFRWWWRKFVLCLSVEQKQTRCTPKVLLKYLNQSAGVCGCGSAFRVYFSLIHRLITGVTIGVRAWTMLYLLVCLQGFKISC